MFSATRSTDKLHKFIVIAGIVLLALGSTMPHSIESELVEARIKHADELNEQGVDFDSQVADVVPNEHPGVPEKRKEAPAENQQRMNAAPRQGDHYLSFDGVDDYVEIPNLRCYSVDHTWEFSLAAWLRADIDDFPTPEKEREYVHWLGKGEGSGAGGTQEWVCRMYSLHTPHEDPPRSKRTSFYVFNPQGGLGVGSYVQPATPVAIGSWRLIVAMADRTHTYLYCDGEYVDCDTYRGPSTCGCSVFTRDGRQVVINPIHGPAPLRIGAQELHKSRFLGGIAKVRIWNRMLSPQEIRALYDRDIAPRDWMAGEFLLNEGQGTVANDTSYMNHGTIHGATWSTQE